LWILNESKRDEEEEEEEEEEVAMPIGKTLKG